MNSKWTIKPIFKTLQISYHMGPVLLNNIRTELMSHLKSLFDTQTIFSKTLSVIKALWKLKQTRHFAVNNLFGCLRVKEYCMICSRLVMVIFVHKLISFWTRFVFCITLWKRNYEGFLLDLIWQRLWNWPCSSHVIYLCYHDQAEAFVTGRSKEVLQSIRIHKYMFVPCFSESFVVLYLIQM